MPRRGQRSAEAKARREARGEQARLRSLLLADKAEREAAETTLDSISKNGLDPERLAKRAKGKVGDAGSPAPQSEKKPVSGDAGSPAPRAEKKPVEIEIDDDDL